MTPRDFTLKEKTISKSKALYLSLCYQAPFATPSGSTTVNHPDALLTSSIMRRRSMLFVTLVASLSVVMAGQPTATLFPQWLEEKLKLATVHADVPSSKAATASYRDTAEFEHVCFKAAATRNCRCIGCLNPCDENQTQVTCDPNRVCCQTFYFE
jgi:hypothetical protein